MGRTPSLHFIEGEGLLLDVEAERLYRLNPSAALVWSLMEDGRSPADIQDVLAADYGMTPDAAAQALAQVLDQWRSNRREPARKRETMETATFRTTGHKPAATEHYALHRSVFAVGYASSALHRALHPLLKPLAVPAQDATPISVDASGDGIALRAGEHLIGSAPALDAAAVALRAALTQLAVEQSGGLCAIHAGALAAGGGALLLPGNAGYGKSTLSAGLAAHGFDMLSDDTTLLVGQPLQAASLPTGLCVKRGAYPVLSPLFPRLSGLPEWDRPDGIRAKYLMPGLDLRWAGRHDHVPVRWLVFPHYDPTHETRLVPLPRAQALERLLPGVYFVSKTLNAANLDALIDWIGGVECFELPLSSLAPAIERLRALCR